VLSRFVPLAVPDTDRSPFSRAEATRTGRRRWLETILSSGAALALEGTALAAPRLGPASSTGSLAAPAAAAPSIHLALNENPFGPSPLALDAIRRELPKLARYTGAEAGELAREIAVREGVLPEQVVLGDVLEALGNQLSSHGAGGEFVYSDPGYTALVDAARGTGGVGVPVPLDSRFENDLPALRARLNARTRALFIVNPHNPSGTVSDAGALHQLVEEASRATTVIVDEAYLEYAPDFPSRTLARQARPDGRVVIFRTFTKFYGLAGLPLSFAILPVELAAQLRKRGLGAPRSLDRLAVAAARASLRDTRYPERVRKAVDTERQRWSGVLDRLRLRHSAAAASFIFFDAGRPQPELAAAFAAQGIEIGRAFPPLDTWARVSIGLPEENARAQRVLEKLVAR
jgi:histidinol-phosphate aminotransferase